MDDIFIGSDDYDEKLKEFETKKKKRQDKNERLQRKRELLEQLQAKLDEKKTPVLQKELNCSNVLQQVESLPKGSIHWVLKLLGINNSTEKELAKRNYYERALHWHPDKTTDIKAHKAMTYLNEAWEIFKKIQEK